MTDPVAGILAEASKAAATAAVEAIQAALPDLHAQVAAASREAVLAGLFGPPVGLVSQPAQDKAAERPLDALEADALRQIEADTAPAAPPPAPAPAAPPPAPPTPPCATAAVDNSPAPLPWEHPDPEPAPGVDWVVVPAAPATNPTIVAPTPGILPQGNLRNLDNWRAWLHQVTPVIVGILTTLGVTTQTAGALWASLFFAVIDPLLSYAHATDKARRIAYGVLGLLQSGGLLVVILGDHQVWLPIATTIVTLVSSTLARFYTPTSTMVPAPAKTGT